MGRLARAVALACSGAVIALAQLHLPDESFWERVEWLQWTAVALAAVLILYEAGDTTAGLARMSRLHKYQRNLHAALSATVAEIVAEFGVPWDEVGACYYHRHRSWPGYRVRLEMVAGVRAGAPVDDLPAVHRVACGLVGTAYSTRMLVTEQWRTFAAEAVAAGPQR